VERLEQTEEDTQRRIDCLGHTDYEIAEAKAKHPPQPQHGRTSLHAAVRANDLASVKTFIRSGEFDVRVTDRYGETALYYGACSHDNPDMIDFIVQAPHGMACLNARNVDGNTPLIRAARYNQHRVLSVLLKYDDIDVSIKGRCSDGRERTALEVATGQR